MTMQELEINDKEEVCEEINNIDIAKDILDRIIGFINNCDIKASISLGLFGVIITIFFTTNGGVKFVDIIKRVIVAVSFCDILFLISLSIAVIMFVFGLWKLISVLSASIKLSGKDSIIYFKDIAENQDCNQYYSKFIAANKNIILKDFIAQIHINSKICSRKFGLYNKGLYCSLGGLVLFILLFIMGNLIY